MSEPATAGSKGFDGKSHHTQARLEALFFRLCPHAENATGPKRFPGSPDGLTPIQGIAFRVGARMRSFEKIENDGIVDTI